MEEVQDTVEVGRPRREPEGPQFLGAEQAEALIEQAREQGIDLLGEGGLLKQMTKAVLERALAEELTEHLGYEVGDPAGNGSGNSRNGYTPKRLLTEAGQVDLDVPRDRNGTHEPMLVRKGQRRLDGIDKIVIGLYAHGMTVRDIQGHLLDIYDIEVSPDLISKITDAVLDEVREWQARPLEPVWPVIFLDAIVCKVRDAGTVKNKAAHLAVGVGVDGKKEVLGIWVEHTEGAKFWLRVMNDLKARGIQDVLIVACDGLTGLPAAIEAVWPAAVVQTCIVHLTRASLRWVNYKDRKRVAAQLRLIYGAPTEQAARDALDAWTDSEVGRQYPAIKRQWEAAWEQVIPFFAFPPEVRKVIYTTDESVNAATITKVCGGWRMVRLPAGRCLMPRPGAAVKVERPVGRTTLTAVRTAVASRGGGRGRPRSKEQEWDCDSCHAA